MHRYKLLHQDLVTGEYLYKGKWYRDYPSEQIEQDEAEQDEHQEREQDERRDEKICRLNA